jgi:hypothetical protein
MRIPLLLCIARIQHSPSRELTCIGTTALFAGIGVFWLAQALNELLVLAAVHAFYVDRIGLGLARRGEA